MNIYVIVKKDLGEKTYRKYFKSYNDFLIYCEIPINKPRNRTKREIDDEIIRVFELAQKENVKFSDAYMRKNVAFTLKPVYRIYHDFVNLENSFDCIKKHNEKFSVTKEKIINDLIEVHELSKKLNEKFNLRFYQKHTNYSLSYLCHYFNSYQDAIERLGLTSNVLPTPTREDYLKEIVKLYNLHGYVSISLLGSESKYKCKGLRYIKEFGGFENILKELNIPHHRNIYKSARQVIDYASKYLEEDPILEKTWYWLKNPNTNYNLFADCYFPKHNIVIEYHGKQHYEYNDFFHKSYDDFLGLQYNDTLKKKLIIERGIKFLEISYKENKSYDNIVKLIENIIYN